MEIYESKFKEMCRNYSINYLSIRCELDIPTFYQGNIINLDMEQMEKLLKVFTAKEVCDMMTNTGRSILKMRLREWVR